MTHFVVYPSFKLPTESEITVHDSTDTSLNDT